MMMKEGTNNNTTENKYFDEAILYYLRIGGRAEYNKKWTEMVKTHLYMFYNTNLLFVVVVEWRLFVIWVYLILNWYENKNLFIKC